MKLIKRIFLLLILLSIILMTSFFTYENNNKNSYSLSESKVPDYSFIANTPQIDDISRIERLKEQYKNDDIVGVLRIPNTNINEVVVQTTDNDYYLNHDLNKQYKKEGSTFLDYRVKINKGQKNLIYSHNSTKKDLPFSELENYYNEEYYQGHEYIELETESEIVRYKIFSVYVEPSDWSYMNVGILESKWLDHLKYLKEKSWYDTNTEVNEKDEILILQTCSFHKNYKNYSHKYLLVIAKKI